MQPVISCMFPQPLVTRTHPSAYDKILSVFLEASLTHSMSFLETMKAQMIILLQMRMRTGG